jgi:hypothetical protein
MDPGVCFARRGSPLGLAYQNALHDESEGHHRICVAIVPDCPKRFKTSTYALEHLRRQPGTLNH